MAGNDALDSGLLSLFLSFTELNELAACITTKDETSNTMRTIGLKYLGIDRKQLEWIERCGGADEQQMKVEVLTAWKLVPGNSKLVRITLLKT